MNDALPLEWRGRINIMLYRVDLRSRVDDDELALIVGSILRRQRFGDDPEEFYGAAFPLSGRACRWPRTTARTRTSSGRR